MKPENQPYNSLPDENPLHNLIFLARDHHQSGRHQQAFDFYQRVLQIDPTNAEILHLLGILHHESGKKNEAIRYIALAIKIDPANPVYLKTVWGVGYRFAEAAELTESAT